MADKRCTGVAGTREAGGEREGEEREEAEEETGEEGEVGEEGCHGARFLTYLEGKVGDAELQNVV